MASIKDIAKLCGVSVATVSKALNDKADISEDTKQHIKQVAKQMGYVPQYYARADPNQQKLQHRCPFYGRCKLWIDARLFFFNIEQFQGDCRGEGL